MRKEQLRTFLLTFFSYGAYHFQRTMWAYIQEPMRRDAELEHYTEKFTGIVNLCFLFVYSISMKIFGPLGGSYNLSFFFSVGSIAAGLNFAVIGLAGLLGYISNPLILVFMTLNGISQCTGWPSLVAIMGNWFKGDNLGLIMGLWAGCTNFGDVFGLLVGDIIVQRLHLSCYYGILVSALYLVLVGFLDILLLHPHPHAQHQVLVQDKEHINPQDSHDSQESNQNKNKINFFSAFCLPGVALYVCSIVCLKGTFYGFLYWLPTYIQKISETLYSQSSYIAQMYDYGTFLGGIGIGLVGDKLGKRVELFCPSLVVAIGLMLVVKYLLGDAPLPYYFVILGIGFFQGGPYNNISGVISIELAKTKQLQGDRKATSLVCSIIEGFGSLSGAVLQLVVPIIGSSYQFLLFTLVTGVAEVCAIVLAVKERQ